MLWLLLRAIGRILFCGFFFGECAVLVLVVHVTSQAYLTQILCGSAKKVCPTDLASSKLVVCIVSCSNCWLCHQRFANSPPPLPCNAYESPEANSARYSLFRSPAPPLETILDFRPPHFSLIFSFRFLFCRHLLGPMMEPLAAMSCSRMSPMRPRSCAV